MRVGRAVKSGVLAGVVAGLLLGMLFFFLLEPIIDTAICYEETRTPNCIPQDQLVPRRIQQLVALIGPLVIGVVLGGVFALLYGGIYPSLPGKSVRVKTLVLGIMAFYAYPLLPALGLPPRPPGVTYGGQDPALTVDVRNTWYGIFLATAVAALALGMYLYHLLVRRYPSRRTHMVAGILSLGVIAGVSALPFLFFPAQDLRVGAPEGLLPLLPIYALISVGSQLAFWVVLAVLFGQFWTRAEARGRAASSAETA